MTFLSLLRADMVSMEIKSQSVWSMILCLVLRLDFLAVFLFRLSVASRKYGWIGRVFGFVFWRLNAFINACDLRPEAEIGPGFSLPHPMGIVMGPIRAGKNLVIHQNVTVGRSRYDDAESHLGDLACLGDDVVIYAGAVIIGCVKIGDHARIGANAVVLGDVLEGQTAYTPPARRLSAKGGSSS